MTGQIPIRFVDPRQDVHSLQRIAREAARILDPQEEILFVAAEETAEATVKRDSVVITTNRIIAFRPGAFSLGALGRVSFHDYPWPDVLEITVEKGMLSAELVISTPTGTQQVGWIALEHAERVGEIARQMEREWRERRRQRELQQARPRAHRV